MTSGPFPCCQRLCLWPHRHALLFKSVKPMWMRPQRHQQRPQQQLIYQQQSMTRAASSSQKCPGILTMYSAMITHRHFRTSKFVAYTMAIDQAPQRAHPGPVIMASGSMASDGAKTTIRLASPSGYRRVHGRLRMAMESAVSYAFQICTSI